LIKEKWFFKAIKTVVYLKIMIINQSKNKNDMFSSKESTVKSNLENCVWNLLRVHFYLKVLYQLNASFSHRKIPCIA
jgi:hypothetical protein